MAVIHDFEVRPHSLSLGIAQYPQHSRGAIIVFDGRGLIATEKGGMPTILTDAEGEVVMGCRRRAASRGFNVGPECVGFRFA